LLATLCASLSLPAQIFQSILFAYAFQLLSEYVLKQEFKPKYALKCVIFIEKS